jgi:hypothetical protein
MEAMATKEPKASPGIEFYGGYQVYSESGVDVAQLRENLRRPLEERWLAAGRAAALLDAFKPSHKEPNVTVFDPATLVRHLTDQQVQFVVIGGLAMISHGSSFVTKDLDLCYQRTEANLEALVKALAPLQPYMRGVPPGLPFRLDVPTLRAGLNFTLTTAHGDLDLLGEVAGIGNYDAVLALSIPKTMFGQEVQVLSIDGLITAKKAADRHKDRGHILELEELKKLREASPEK